jgi:hypothetical protein
MRLLAIDPGCTHTAYVFLEGDKVVEFAKEENNDVLE